MGGRINAASGISTAQFMPPTCKPSTAQLPAMQDATPWWHQTPLCLHQHLLPSKLDIVWAGLLAGPDGQPFICQGDLLGAVGLLLLLLLIT